MTMMQSLSAQAWIARLALTLLHFLWQGTLIAGGTWIAGAYVATRTGRSRTASSRYSLACVALSAMALAPVVTFVLLGPGTGAQSAANVSTIGFQPISERPEPKECW